MIRFALLFPLWLALATGETQLLHSCPMHHVGAAHAAKGENGGSAHHAHGAVPSPDAPQPEHQACSCVGPCTLAGAAIVPSAPSTALAVVVAIPERAPRASHATPRSRVDRLLPYSNGPPSRRS